MNTQRVIDYTQARVDTWYKNAKIDYDVTGGGVVRLSGDSITIDYLEDDKSGSFALPLSVLQEEDVNYLFNNWMEL